MLVPIAWLRDYLDAPGSSDDLSETFASLGFPVADVVRRPRISGVIAGRITKLEKHPNADRLHVCTLDVGGERPLTIATAATNVAQDQIVPVATIGAQLPGLTIAPRKMRGIDSEGMLCSAEELGLEPAWFEDGIMQLDASIRLGTDVVEAFGLLDDVLDVEVTSNRPDALSIVGLARELAAAYGADLRMPDTSVTFDERAPARGDVRVSLESPDARRFVAQRVTGLQVRTASARMRVRLALAGVRPINNLVDISNFVMLELGQPQHFYDFANVRNGHIVVRDARPGERIVTLDDEERILDATSLVIADDERATGLAGLKGGQINEISDTTTDVLVESATFSGARIRRMSVALGLRTEASSRHEKTLPYGLADVAAARAAHLLAAEGGHVHPPEIFGAGEGTPVTLPLAPREVRRLVGFDADAGEIARTLERLGFRVHAETIDGAVLALDVTVPYWRTDVSIAADLVEEFARVAGYDRVPATIPPVFEQAVSSAEFERERDVAHTLAALGYNEAVTFALQPATVAERLRRAGVTVPDPVEIRNPLSEDQRFMRFSLFPALLELLARERSRPLGFFELGHVFEDDAADVRERSDAAFAYARDGESPFLAVKSDAAALVRAVCGRDAEFARATMPMLHPGKTAAITVEGTTVGYVGIIDPRAARAFDVESEIGAALVFLEALPAYRVARYRAPSRYPAVLRDLAVVLDDARPAGDVVRTIRGAGDGLLAGVTIFDEYRGPQVGAGKKSLAVRIALQRDDATMTDDQADAAIARILSALESELGAKLRT